MLTCRVETKTRAIDDASTCTARPGQLTSPSQSTARIDEHEPGNKLNKLNNLLPNLITERTEKAHSSAPVGTRVDIHTALVLLGRTVDGNDGSGGIRNDFLGSLSSDQPSLGCTAEASPCHAPGPIPLINLATEDHQLYANWAEMHSVSSPPYVGLNEREASLGFHHAETIPCSPVAASARDVLVRALIRISRTQVSISGCERARYIQLRNARVAKKADS